MSPLLLLSACLAFGAAPPPSKDALEKGKTSFEINCAACHGVTGAGDGAAAAALTPRPRSFKVDPFKNGDTAENVFKSVSEGIPTTAMVAFAHLKEEERWSLAYYVLELRGPAKAPAAAAPAPAKKNAKKK